MAKETRFVIAVIVATDDGPRQHYLSNPDTWYWSLLRSDGWTWKVEAEAKHVLHTINAVHLPPTAYPVTLRVVGSD